MRTLAALILSLLACGAQAQDLPPIATVLQRLHAYSVQYRERLPSLTCDESILSESLKNGKVKKKVRIEATLREVRDQPGPDPFSEKVEFKTVNGRPAKPFFKIPFIVQGGFANLVGFAHAEADPCIDYKLSPVSGSANLRLEMTPKPDAANEDCARVPAGYHRIVLFDPASGRILRTERTYPTRLNQPTTEVYYAAIDYAPQKLGSEIFWLPLNFTVHDEYDQRRMQATYSNYHRYAGEMTVLPGATPADPTRPRP